MAKYLVIVESPAKVKTIKKFLGSNYDVEASNGHVRDFPKSQFGIDVEHDFEPKYITIRGKGELLAKLRKSAKKADKIYLATDPDREGEALSWHLMQALKEDPKKMHRITPATSAIGKDHHTRFSTRNRDRMYAAGSSTTSWRISENIRLRNPCPSAWNAEEETTQKPAKVKLRLMIRSAGIPMASMSSEASNSRSRSLGISWNTASPISIMLIA